MSGCLLGLTGVSDGAVPATPTVNASSTSNPLPVLSGTLSSNEIQSAAINFIGQWWEIDDLGSVSLPGFAHNASTETWSLDLSALDITPAPTPMTAEGSYDVQLLVFEFTNQTGDAASDLTTGEVTFDTNAAISVATFNPSPGGYSVGGSITDVELGQPVEVVVTDLVGTSLTNWTTVAPTEGGGHLGPRDVRGRSGARHGNGMCDDL